MSSAGRILLIEDDHVQSLLLTKYMTINDYEVESHTSGRSGLQAALENDFDAVVTDLNLPEVGGLELLGRIHVSKPLMPVIVITGGGTTETAIESTKLGAFDYLMKPVKPDELLSILAKGVNSYRLSTETVGMGHGGATQRTIVGTSGVMQQLFKDIGRAAAQSVPVLIQGETGSGKEMVARALYKHSDRSSKPFVALNCAAIPEQLLESELFGHERGAFTGATMRRIGRFEQASGGTIFLDEIGDLSFSTQAKLLRVLQEQEIQRLGGQEAIKVDARIIAATHKDLEKAIAERTFREDLYFRLNVVRIRIPSLRERPSDIPDLVHYFLAQYGEKLQMPKVSIGPEAMEVLRAQSWPGNVRELENVIRKAMLASQGYQISPEVLHPIMEDRGVVAPGAAVDAPGEKPTEVDGAEAPATETSAGGSGTFAPTGVENLRGYVEEVVAACEREGSGDGVARFIGECEKLLFTVALERAGFNRTKAAEWLGVSRVTMREKLKRHGIEVPGRSAG